MRRRRPPAPVEPPAWVRVFDPDAWAEPDEQEQQMAGDRGLPPEVRRWHAERRWCAAVNGWYREHPEADRRAQELQEAR